jgi:hypothetical protein
MKVKHLLHCHLLLKGVFPEMAVAAPRLPALESMLAFSHARELTEGGADLWLCNHFGVARQNDLPVAPFAALGDGLAPGGQFWLHADPVHFHLLRDSITLADCVPFDLAADEAAQLADALNRHFAADGMQFFAPHANRWYLRLAAAPDIRTHPLAQAIGRDVDHLLPQGADAMQWHGWLNEAQMLLHAHPVNLAREERGLLPVNSIWPWGGGVLLQPAALPFSHVWAQDVLVRGLVQANGGAAQPLPSSALEWLEQAQGGGTHLLVLDDLENADFRGDTGNWNEALEYLERHWFSPLLEATRRGRVAGVDLHLAGLHQVKNFALERDELWKFWRRPKPLKAFLDD